MSSLNAFDSVIRYDRDAFHPMDITEALLCGVSPMYGCLPESEKQFFRLHLEKAMRKELTIEALVTYLGGTVFEINGECTESDPLSVVVRRLRPTGEVDKKSSAKEGQSELLRANKRFAKTTHKVESKKRLRQFLRTGIRSEIKKDRKETVYGDDYIRLLSEQQQGGGDRAWQELSDGDKMEKIRMFARAGGTTETEEALLRKWGSSELGKVHYSATEGRVFRIGSKIMKPKKNTLARIKEDRRVYKLASNRMTHMGTTFANSVYSSGV